MTEVSKGFEGNQSDKIEEVEKELSKNQKKIDGYTAGIQYEGQIVDILTKKTGDLESLKKDPDGQITYQMYLTALSRKDDLIIKKNFLLANSETKVVDSKIDDGESKNSLEKIDIQSISNKEFIENIAERERLKYITTGSIESSKVASGEIKDMTFTFANKNLYMMTTAGQTLPQEVATVEVNGMEYTRINNSLKGEFYNSANQRLKIHGGGFGGKDTQLSVTKLRSKEDIQGIGGDLKKKLEGYKITGESEKYVAIEALEKGIDVKTFSTVINRRFENAEELITTNPREYHARLEQYSTEVLRVLSQNKEAIQGGEYSIETSAEIFKKLTPASWEKTLSELGFNQEEIDAHKKSSNFNEKNFGAEYEGYLPAEYSSPYKSETKTRNTGETYKVTFCSETARLNFEKFGLYPPVIPRGDSATASMNLYPAGRVNSMSRITNIPEGVDVLDIFSRAKGTNARDNNWGHRAAAFKDGGQWFVLDPYTKTQANKDIREKPIPLNMYLNSGRDFKGFAMHEANK